jgi:hypothetical protein
MTWMRDDRVAGGLARSVRSSLSRFSYSALPRGYASWPEPVGAMRPAYVPASLGPFGLYIGIVELGIDDIKSVPVIFRRKYVLDHPDGLGKRGFEPERPSPRPGTACTRRLQLQALAEAGSYAASGPYSPPPRHPAHPGQAVDLTFITGVCSARS